MSTLRFMRTFLAVAHHGTFAEAAEQVALTQAAVSFQMRSLEAELGRELFDRSGRLAILNAAGRELLPEIKQLLDMYERLRAPRHASDALAGAVSVGAIVSCMGMLSKVVTRMKREHPGLDVRVFSGKASELAGKVETGELDAALIVEAGRKRASTKWTPLYQEPLVVVAHPAAAGGQDVREVLRANPFLRFDRTQRTGLQIERVLRRLGLPLTEFLELNAIETLVELVRQQAGVTLLPCSMAPTGGKAGTCAYCRCPPTWAPRRAPSACWSGASTPGKTSRRRSASNAFWVFTLRRQADAASLDPNSRRISRNRLTAR